MPRPLKNDGDEARRAEMLRRYHEGARTADLAREFGMNPASVYDYCERHSRDPSGKTRAQRERAERARAARRKRAAWEKLVAARAARNAEIRRLWSEGWSGASLARRFEVSDATVALIVAGLRRLRPLRGGDPEEAAWPLPRRRLIAGPSAPRPSPVAPPGPADPRDAMGSRYNAMKGSAHGRSKLTEADVEEMRRLHSEGWSGYRLADRFGVSMNTARNAIKGATWGHVEPKGGGPCST